MRLLIFHTGRMGSEQYRNFFKLIEELNYNLVGFTSFDEKIFFRKMDEYTVYPPDALVLLKYDKILIGESSLSQINDWKKRFFDIGLSEEKISSIYWILKQFMMKKYEDIADPVIQETLTYWQNHELSVFNQHIDENQHTYDEVFIDESCGLPYINFETIEGKKRRMYYPRDGSEQVKGDDGKKYIRNVLREQIPTSPHLYVKDSHKVEEGDVLIDAGVCEGNFSLRYADIVSKIYLFESDKKWLEPLYYSFKDFWDKVDFIPKFVSDSTHGSNVALDDVIDIPAGSKVFLKMDIEGAEPAALRGAKRILTANKVKASVCSYHNSNDIVKIKSLLHNYGYKTSASAGYMVFVYDPKILETADFRKGMVYAENF